MNATAPSPQADLFDVKPDKASRDVAWLENLLRGAGCWMPAKEILISIGREPSDDNKRWLRDIANRARCVLSGPGSPGYKHIGHCTPEEIEHYKNSLISQGKDMIRRGLKIQRAAHEIFAR